MRGDCSTYRRIGLALRPARAVAEIQITTVPGYVVLNVPTCW